MNNKNKDPKNSINIEKTLNKLTEDFQILAEAQSHYFSIIEKYFNESFTVYNFKSKPVPRNFRIYPEILEKLQLLKEHYPTYSMQGIINTLLMESLDKYLIQKGENK